MVATTTRPTGTIVHRIVAEMTLNIDRDGSEHARRRRLLKAGAEPCARYDLWRLPDDWRERAHE